jgi:hypothetical protein
MPAIVGLFALITRIFRAAFVFSPGLVQAKVRIVLRLPKDRVAIREKNLQSRIPDVVVAAKVDQL